MRLLRKSLFAAAVAVWLFIVLNSTAEPAHAYVDPGSGMFLLQIIGSTFAGFTFVMRRRIRTLMQKIPFLSRRESLNADR